MTKRDLRGVTAASIIATVARRYGVKFKDITGRSLAIVPTRARQAAMLALREQLGLTLVEIGRAVNRHNTTVDIGIKTAAARRGTPVRVPARERVPGWRPAGPGRALPRDPITIAPIGAIPKDHPLYEVDQAIVRARQKRPLAVGGWRQSSLADLG